MFGILLALMLPAQQAMEPIIRELSPIWVPFATIETGQKHLAFITIRPTRSTEDNTLYSVDSSGEIAELSFDDRQWNVARRFQVGEAVTTGCHAALRQEEIWSLVVGTVSGRIVEMRPGLMGWSSNEIVKEKPPLKVVAATEAGRPGPSQLFVIDADGAVANIYQTASGKWHRRLMPAIEGGATAITFDYSVIGPVAFVAGATGEIHRFEQDTLGNWAGTSWGNTKSECREMVTLATPSKRGELLLYGGVDGHVRFLWSGRSDDSSRAPAAFGARNLIGRGDQRRVNEFFAMSEGEICMFEYDYALQEWSRTAFQAIPGKVVSLAHGQARSVVTWHTMLAATADGKIYELVRMGLENE